MNTVFISDHILQNTENNKRTHTYKEKKTHDTENMTEIGNRRTFIDSNATAIATYDKFM